MQNRSDEAYRRLHARVAGIAYLLIILIALLNVNLLDARLIVPGDSAATAGNILAHDLLFRLRIAGELAMYAGVLVLSWSLYVLLRPVRKDLALLALLFRAGEAILGAAAVPIGFAVLLLATGSGMAAALGTEPLHALVALLLDLRMAALDVVLVFVGVGGTIYCTLFFTSRSIPRALAAWGIFSYLSMLVLSFVSIVFPAHPPVLEIVLYGAGALFELVIGLWLLFAGVRSVPAG